MTEMQIVGNPSPRYASSMSSDARDDSRDLFHGFVSMQSRGLMALPAVLRKRYRLDEPGTQMEISERSDGVLELRPAVAVPATEAWFWTDAWQSGEREVEEFLASGSVTVTDGVDEFVGSLPDADALPTPSHPIA